MLRQFDFHGILVDEVAQATETSTIVPLVLRGAKQLVLCGDHCQLPPSVVSQEAELRGMSMSIYTRLVDCGLQPYFLDTQYRSHPKLAEFSAQQFYRGILKTGIKAELRPMPKGIPWPNPECPVAFYKISAPEELDGESKASPVEAEKVLAVINSLLIRGGGEFCLEDIGVVTPYKGQVRVLRRLLRTALPELQEKGKDKDLEIFSVDNFQGREKEVMIFSAVRCNEEGKVGFLADWRRLNVMITRARRGLVIIGDPTTLHCDTHWSAWLKFADANNAIVPGDDTAQYSGELARQLGRLWNSDEQNKSQKRGYAWLAEAAKEMMAKEEEEQEQMVEAQKKKAIEEHVAKKARLAALTNDSETGSGENVEGDGQAGASPAPVDLGTAAPADGTFTPPDV